MPRTLPVVLVAIAAAVAGFLVGRSTAPSADAPSLPAAQARARDLGAEPPRLVGASEARDATAPGSARPAVAEAQAPETEDASAAWIDVHVVPPAGEYGMGTVYAIPAGAEGADDVTSVPHEDAKSTTRVRVPAPGLYDVGFTDGGRWVLVGDVEARPTGTAEIRVPPPIHVRLRWSDLPDRRDPSQTQLVLHAQRYGERARGAPGRGEVLATSQEGYAPLGTESAPLYLSDEAPIELRAEVREVQMTGGMGGEPEVPAWVSSSRYLVELDRSRVRADDELHVRIVALGKLRVHAVPDPSPWPAVDTWLRFSMQEAFSGDAGLQVQGGMWTPDLVVSARPGTWTLRWSGNQVAPGELADVVVSADRTTDVVARVKHDPEAHEPGGELVTEAEMLRLEFEGLGESDRTLRALGLLPAEDPQDVEASDLVVDEGAAMLPPPWRAARRLVVFTANGLVSEPVDVGGRASLRVAMRRGGFLLCAPDEVLPLELGSLTLEREDGMFLHSPEECARRFPASAGSMIGPLPAGTYAFRVRLGGVELPRATATVRAGRITPLVVRRR